MYSFCLGGDTLLFFIATDQPAPVAIDYRHIQTDNYKNTTVWKSCKGVAFYMLFILLPNKEQIMQSRQA